MMIKKLITFMLALIFASSSIMHTYSTNPVIHPISPTILGTAAARKIPASTSAADKISSGLYQLAEDVLSQSWMDFKNAFYWSTLTREEKLQIKSDAWFALCLIATAALAKAYYDIYNLKNWVRKPSNESTTVTYK